ncbi:hypothetical protein SKAU_G00401520 [Synaphobranchus kaupii]|uniref:Uncharacterized protein n=1 Tax=Synaphobranchus kaupii TaxID=118154 RepID=A0A9Q1IAE6_SYNKA|nr:hypothetical protein SKAU_G00401520 [Synaphobranchus kaupii]
MEAETAVRVSQTSLSRRGSQVTIALDLPFFSPPKPQDMPTGGCDCSRRENPDSCKQRGVSPAPRIKGGSQHLKSKLISDQHCYSEALDDNGPRRL